MQSDDTQGIARPPHATPYDWKEGHRCIEAWPLRERQHQTQLSPAEEPVFLRAFRQGDSALELLDRFTSPTAIAKDIPNDDVAPASEVGTAAN